MTQSVESSVTATTGVAAPKTVEHDIPLYLASDEALIHILDRYPEDLLEINSSDFDTDGQGSLGVATRARPDGRTILAAIKAGRLSVSLRSCERAHPGLCGPRPSAPSRTSRPSSAPPPKASAVPAR